MLTNADRATAAYFGGVLATILADPGTPDTVLDTVEAVAARAYLDAYATALDAMTHPHTPCDASEARSVAYSAARDAAHAHLTDRVLAA